MKLNVRGSVLLFHGLVGVIADSSKRVLLRLSLGKAWESWMHVPVLDDITVTPSRLAEAGVAVVHE